jgi:hypothetical protein
MLGQRGAMAMAEHADVWLVSVQPGLRLGRQLPFFIEHMTKRNLQSAALKEASAGKTARFILVHIA